MSASDLNNCGCAENHFDEDMVERVMQGSVRMAADQGWDGVKFDSCSMMHNLSRWSELINASGRPMLIENCHQGAYTPGMRQWQGYVKNASAPSGFSHFLGMFFGMGDATVMPNVSVPTCRTHCKSLNTSCGGYTFVADVPEPSENIDCYIKAKAACNHMDMSNSNYCKGDADPSDCPFNLYRVSGDISGSFKAMLTNLEYALPFLGQGGLHPPYPQDHVMRSRPGGWAYPE
eukprot:COSAG02_NODE_633_length_19262_cov_32.473256_3_plen_232_part_00